MNYDGLLRENARYYPKAYSQAPLTLSDVESYLNDHQFTDELKVISPDTQRTAHYRTVDQPWRGAYDPDCMENMWASGYSFIIETPYVSDAVKGIVRSIEAANHVSCDAHVYMGKANSHSFEPHDDNAHNLIVQCAGITLWRVWTDGYEPFIDVVMEPGDAIFIPKGTTHQAQPLSDRMSVSFPFFPGPKTIHRDISLEWVDGEYGIIDKPL